ncbi:MAG: KOW domain-containing RNA-binding protein [Firmicutes bacterium]|nr:KOW domain-containing RNA-binding protein [Bacillota bacterium]
MDIGRGSLVYSRAGRDKGGLFLVLAADEDNVYLADGVTRRVSKPKKKKRKHINKTNTVLELDFENISDSAVRKALASIKTD